MTDAAFISPGRWRTLEPLLDAALETAPERRAAFLDDACGGDAALRAELQAMLEQCAHAEDDRLSRPAAERFAALLDGREELGQLRAALAPDYVVERELGRGGMGTVYLARDVRHERDVAVKVLAPELADGTSAARFLDEIRVTARLRHPQILPLFDSGVADGQPWYVSPYVEGGTLRDRLRREGALPVADALRVLREVAIALAFAHARGIVHRDVTPDNVLLDIGGGVLGDFGIARAVARATEPGAAPVLALLTAPDFGTPTYMAPEQRTPGATIDHRVDLYALGVIAHEMLYGRPPAPLEPADRRSPEVPPALASLLARLLAERPEARPASADEVLRVLDEIGGGAAGQARGRARRTAVGALVVAAVLAAAGATAWTVRERHAAVSLSPRHVLVVPFENATADPALAPLGRMAADWVGEGLAEPGVVEVGSEHSRPDTPGEQGLRAAARQRGAGLLLSGAYYLDGDSVRLQARVTNVADGTLRQAIAPVAAARSAPQTLVAPLRQRVMAALAVTYDPRSTGWVMGAPPPTFEAYERYLAGLDRFTEGDWAGALPLWERAAALDSSFVQPLLHSAFGYLNLGRWAEADSLVRLVESRERLTRFDRAMLDYLRAELAGDAVSALTAARAMVNAAPGTNLPHYLRAYAALRALRPHETIEAAARISPRDERFATPWSSGLYWRVVSNAYHLLGDHASELEAVRGARERHPANREILWCELRALAALGRLGGLERSLDELEALPAIPSGRSLPRILLELADELEAHGHADAARAVLLRVEQRWRAHAPDAELRPDERYEQARTLARLGHDAAAETILVRLATERSGDLRTLAERGVIAARQGRAAEAERIGEQLRRERAQYDFGFTSYARARIAAHSGDRALALALLRQAFAEGFVGGSALHADPGLAPLREEPEFRELLRPKG
jgi:serine/threonine protein kinase